MAQLSAPKKEGKKVGLEHPIFEVSCDRDRERVILFGSYAEGRATADSDVDLFVEMDHTQSSLQQALAIHFRYPGESADKAEAKLAVDAMERCRIEICPHLA